MDRIDLIQEAYLGNHFSAAIEARCAQVNPPLAIADPLKFHLLPNFFDRQQIANEYALNSLTPFAFLGLRYSYIEFLNFQDEFKVFPC
jgi:hypothetical protein